MIGIRVLGMVSIMDILYFIMKAATPHEEFEKNYPAAHQIQCAGPDRHNKKQMIIKQEDWARITQSKDQSNIKQDFHKSSTDLSEWFGTTIKVDQSGKIWHQEEFLEN